MLLKEAKRKIVKATGKYLIESQGRAVIESTNPIEFHFERGPVIVAIARITAKAAGTSG